jgi:hypothetical protein
VKVTVRKLQAVLVIPSDKPLEIIHPSFIDFLTNKERCSDANFFIDSSLQHLSLAARCLHIMNSSLKANICNVDPSLFNSEVKDLQERISTNISPPLHYACRFWAFHLSHADPTAELHDLLEILYFKHLLAWIEVMSLLGLFVEIMGMIETAQEWISVSLFLVL